MYQTCPICKGSGQISDVGTSSSCYKVCDVCLGEKIINTETGLPPSKRIHTIIIDGNDLIANLSVTCTTPIYKKEL